MRINIYNDDLSDRIAFLDDKVVKGSRFYGVRFYLGKPNEDSSEDESNAVTFWASDMNRLREIFETALSRIGERPVL